MNELILRQCPICDNLNPEFMRQVDEVEGVNRLLCHACDTIYFDREPPTPAKYDIAYNKFFFRPGDIRKAGIMAAKLAEQISGRFKHPNILEAGAGNGLTVLLLRAMGYNAFGLDLDPKLSVFLMESFKIPIISSKFEEFNPPGKYHLIYSSHVIEHTKNPKDFMKKAFDLLEEKGILFLDTPDTFFYNKENKRWHHFETRSPFEHSCLLGQVGMRLLAQGAGFNIEEIERYDEYMSLQAILIKGTK